MFRSFVVITAVTASALSLYAAADTPPIRVVEEIAAKVNGDIITRGELEKKRLEIEAAARQQGLTGPRLKEAVDGAFNNALMEEIDQLLLVQKGKDLNINVDNEVIRWLAEIQMQQKAAHPELADPDKFQSFIRQETGMTFEDFKQQKKNQLLTQRVIGQEVVRTINVPEVELQKYYEEHKTEFVRQEQVFLSQIVISTEGKTPAQVAAAEAKAKDLVTRARKGDKFSDMARDNSDDETGKSGGYIGAVPRGQMDKVLEDMVFKEKKGFVSDPVKRAANILILKVEERFEAGQASFEEVKNEIQERLVQPRVDAKARIFLSRLREDAFLEIKEGYVDNGAVPGKDTRWKDLAQLKPQTITKEEVAARRKKHILWVIPNGYAKTTGSKAAPAAAAAPATPGATPAGPDKTPIPDKK
jgi:parvulin-like peptidyl-prolyl isomerase